MAAAPSSPRSVSRIDTCAALGLPPETPAAAIQMIERLREEIAELTSAGQAVTGSDFEDHLRCLHCNVLLASPLAKFCHQCGLSTAGRTAVVVPTGAGVGAAVDDGTLTRRLPIGSRTLGGTTDMEREFRRKLEASRLRQKKFNSLPNERSQKLHSATRILSLIPVQPARSEIPPSEGLQKLKDGIQCIRYKPRFKPAVRDLYLVLDEKLGVGGGLFWVDPSKRISHRSTSHIRITDIFSIIPGKHSDVLRDVPHSSDSCLSVIGLVNELHAAFPNRHIRDAVVQALVDAGVGVGHFISVLALNCHFEPKEDLAAATAPAGLGTPSRPVGKAVPSSPNTKATVSPAAAQEEVLTSLQESWKDSSRSVAKDLPRLWDKISIRVLNRLLLDRGQLVPDWRTVPLPGYSPSRDAPLGNHSVAGSAAGEEEEKKEDPAGPHRDGEVPAVPAAVAENADDSASEKSRVCSGIEDVVNAIAFVMETPERRAVIAAELSKLSENFVQGQDREALLNDFFEAHLGLESLTMKVLQSIHQKLIFPALKQLITWVYEPVSSSQGSPVQQRLLLDARNLPDNWLVSLAFSESEICVSHTRLAKSDLDPKSKAQWILKWNLNLIFAPEFQKLEDVSLRAVSFDIPDTVPKKEKARLMGRLRQTAGYIMPVS